MSQTFLSPGTDMVEVDQSFIQQGAPQPGAILIGRTLKGPAFYPVTVRNFSEFTAVFGGTDPAYQVPYAAKNYLKNSTSLTVVRVLGHSDNTSANNGYSLGSVVGITDTSGGINVTGSVLAVLHANVTASSVQIAGVPADSNRFTVRIGSTFAVTASFLTSSDDYVGKTLNTDPTKFSTYGHYVYQLFPYAKPAASASWSGVSILSQSLTTFQRNYDHGRTTWIKSQPLGGVEYDLFMFHTLGRGRATNDDVKVQIDNVKPSSAPSSYPYGSFDVVVRSFYDTDSRPVELERFANLNLDPASPNYVLRRIGDINETFDSNTRKFAVVSGQWPNRSRFIRVELNTAANFPPQALPWGFRGYAKVSFSGSSLGNGGAFGLAAVPSLPYVPNQVDPNGNYNGNIAWGVSFVSGGVVDRMRAAPDNALLAGLSGTDADFSLSNLTSSYVNGNLRYSYLSTWGRYSPIFASASMQSFTVPFWGGFDGFDLRVQDPLYLNNSDGDSVIGVVSLKRAVDCVANPDQIIGDTLALPGQHNVAVTDYARSLANARKDMFYVMDLTGSTRQEVIANLNAREIDDNYTAGYYPDLVYSDTVSNRMVRVPASVGVMGALAYNDRVGQAFFAPAGLNRGGLSQFGIVDIVDRLNHDDRDSLYDQRVNPITKFPVEGIVIFGQKTLQRLPSSLDRVNVRRLLILAKRTVASFARQLLFEPNNPATWTRFTNKVNPVLEQYRKDQGINRFKVVMDNTTNTSDVIDRNEMRGKIFLEPVRAAEFITIDFVITPSGVEFGS
ncbi:MAG TPA: phage tail sheath C-terminal domain-containing protein [Isosphaeraceae bacterium]|nr:phage tail sheath C-terminal domain-containing protein [Isosphaeraceae bacterium]